MDSHHQRYFEDRAPLIRHSSAVHCPHCEL